jgi:ketosteroid isomerase-like protein
MGELTGKVQEFYDRFGAGDLDGAIELFDPDVESVSPGGTLMGAEAFRGYGQTFKTAFLDSGMRVLSAIESGDTVAVEGVYTGTHTGTLATPMGDVPATGRSIALPFCDLFRFEGGLVVSHHVYWDQLAFMTQLGLMPEPSPAGA